MREIGAVRRSGRGGPAPARTKRGERDQLSFGGLHSARQHHDGRALAAAKPDRPWAGSGGRPAKAAACTGAPGRARADGTGGTGGTADPDRPAARGQRRDRAAPAMTWRTFLAAISRISG